MVQHITFPEQWKKREHDIEVTQSCPTLWDPKDCSLPGSSVRGIFQARVLDWVAISFSRTSSWPRGWTWVSHIVGRRFTVWTTREVWEKGILTKIQDCHFHFAAGAGAKLTTIFDTTSYLSPTLLWTWSLNTLYFFKPWIIYHVTNPLKPKVQLELW